MTFLELCQRTALECGISGTITSTLNQSGENKRVVSWVSAAWHDIQLLRPDWLWMRGNFSFNTIASQDAYTSLQAGITTRFLQWNTTNIILNNSFIPHIDWSDFVAAYALSNIQSGQPIACTTTPAIELKFAPSPNAAYAVSGEYYKTPQELAVDSDIPEMPTTFHMAIVYRAMMKYARYDAAGEIYSDAQIEYRRMIKSLELNQLQSIGMAGALA